jgi:hypothetical protein
MARHEDGRFEPFDTTTATHLGQAFDNAWETLTATDATPALSLAESERLREMLALRIIKLAQDGERDPDTLRDAALAYVRQTVRLAGAA